MIALHNQIAAAAHTAMKEYYSSHAPVLRRLAAPLSKEAFSMRGGTQHCIGVILSEGTAQ